MNQKIAILIIVSLFMFNAVCAVPTKAQEYTDITINTDGSINPATAPITQAENLYTLTGNITGSLRILKNNMTLEGYSYTLAGWLAIENSSVTVKNLIVTGTGAVTDIVNWSTEPPYYWNFGILTDKVSNVKLINNVVNTQRTNDCAGIYVNGGHSNTISNNIIVGNAVGLAFIKTSNNQIYHNNISDNWGYTGISGSYGLKFIGSSGNTVYNNYFSNNSAMSGQFFNLISINSWDNGERGNFWSDYNGTDKNNDGIGDTPYSINSNETDNFPLMEPVFTHDKFGITTEPSNDYLPIVIATILITSIIVGAIIVLRLSKKNRKITNNYSIKQKC